MRRRVWQLLCIAVIVVVFAQQGSCARLRVQTTLQNRMKEDTPAAAANAPTSEEELEKRKEMEEEASKLREELKSVVDEQEMKKIISEQLQPVKDILDSQSAALTKSLKETSNEMSEQIGKMSKDITGNVDKMARHISNQMNSVREAVESNQKANVDLTLVILQSHLKELQAEEEQLKESVEILESELPSISSVCENHVTCGSCTANPACGWCNMEQRCVEGDNIGPLKVACSFYNYNYCAGPECATYSDCNSCLSNLSCGWCNDQRRFIEGCIQSENHGCPIDGWYSQENEDKNICPAKKQYLEEMTNGEQQDKQLMKEIDEERSSRGKLNAEINTPSERQIIFKKKQEELVKKQKRLEEVMQQIEDTQEKLVGVKEKYEKQEILEKEQEKKKIELSSQEDFLNKQGLPESDKTSMNQTINSQEIPAAAVGEGTAKTPNPEESTTTTPKATAEESTAESSTVASNAGSSTEESKLAESSVKSSSQQVEEEAQTQVKQEVDTKVVEPVSAKDGEESSGNTTSSSSAALTTSGETTTFSAKNNHTDKEQTKIVDVTKLKSDSTLYEMFD